MITQAQVRLDISNLMGKRTLPQGTTADWDRYAQYAFDYAWRYHRWDFSLKTSPVTIISGEADMPADFDLEAWTSIPNPGGRDYQYMPLEDFLKEDDQTFIYTFTFNLTTGLYKLKIGAPDSTIDIVYQVAPPTLNDSPGVPFFSSMTIAVGSVVFAKQGENPTKAEVTQEWDEFHAFLNKHVGLAERNKPVQRRRTYADRFGSYTGRVS